MLYYTLLLNVCMSTNIKSYIYIYIHNVHAMLLCYYLTKTDARRTGIPRIFESQLRDHCAKKLVGALRKPTSFV